MIMTLRNRKKNDTAKKKNNLENDADFKQVRIYKGKINKIIISICNILLTGK